MSTAGWLDADHGDGILIGKGRGPDYRSRILHGISVAPFYSTLIS